MNLQLESKTEARIQERIRTGKYATPNDVVLAGLNLLEQHERARATDLANIRGQVASGLQQLDRGEGLDGEEVFAELLAGLEEQRDSK